MTAHTQPALIPSATALARRCLDSAERIAATSPTLALADLTSAQRLLDEAKIEYVRAARAAGESWDRIAAGLCVSRQSAHSKYASQIRTPR